jgi:hypothetical protein
MAALDANSARTRPARDATHFRRIVSARKALTTAETDLIIAVRAALEAGDSWTVIGAAMGTSRQGRFGHLIDHE